MIAALAQKRRTATLAAVFILSLAAIVGALLAGGPAQAQSGGINLTATSLSVDENDEYWQYFQLSLASAPDGYVGINVEVDSQTDARFVVGVTNSYGQFVDCEAGETCYIHINDDEWNDQQVVYVNALIDDNRAGGSGKIKITTESGDPDYDGVTGEVSLTEYDTVGAAMLFPDGRPSYISEGGNASFSVQLAVEPYHDVTVTVTSSHDDITVAQGASLTFTASNYSSKQWVRLDAKEDDIALTAQSTITVKSESDDNDYDLSGSFTITEIENDTARFVLSNYQSSLTVTEGGSSHTYSVRLDSEPSANVTVAIAKAAGGDASISVSPASLTFTPANYAAQTVTISAAQDGDQTTDTATITHTVSGAAEYAALSIGNVAVTARDDDVAIDLNPTALTVGEGGTATYTVGLNIAPTADVTVTIAEATNGDDSIRVTSSKTLTFTPSNYGAQTVSIRANGDGDNVNGTRTINHSANGAEFTGVAKSLTVTERDRDAVIKLVDADPNSGRGITSLDVPENGSATYKVSLGAKPASDVTVSLSADTDGDGSPDGDGNITFDPSSLDFTANNYSDTQTVTVSAATDADLVNGSATIVHTAAGGGYDGAPVRNLTAREVDNTGQLVITPASLVSNTPADLDVQEGGSATYTVALSHQPTGSVTVRLALQSTSADGDSNISRSPSTLYFNTNNWNQAQTVTVRASQDSDAERGSRTITHTASGGGYNAATTSRVVTARELDDEAAPVLTNTDDNPITKLSVAEGGAAMDYKVALSTAPAAGVTVTVDIASSGNLGVTLSQSSLTFTSATWNQAQTVTVTAGSDDDALNDSATITHTGNNGYGSTELAVTETDVTPGVVITSSGNNVVTGGGKNYGINVPEGTSVQYQVELKSEPTGNVTVSLALQSTSGDNPGDQHISRSPSTLYFNTGNWDQPKTVTVRASQDSDKTSGTRKITHTASGGGYNSATEVVLTATEQDDEAGLVFTAGGSSVTALDVPEGGTAAYTVALSSAPTADVTVAIAGGAGTGDDTHVTVKDTDDGTTGDQTTDITFTSQNWETARTVTLAAAEDSDPDNGTRNITHTVTSTDVNYNGQSVHLTAVEADNDHDIIIRNAADTVDISTLGVPEGGSETYKVKLAVKPTGNVTVTITEEATGDTDLRLTSGQAKSTKTLRFNAGNYNRAQTVRVYAAQDNNDSLDGRRKLLHTASGGGYDIATPVELLATEQDNDKQLFIHDGNYNGITTLFVPEGGTARYVIELRQNPSGPVIVNLRALTGGDPDIAFDTDLDTNGVQTGAVTLSAGNLRATVEVSAAPDKDETAGSITIRHTPTGTGFDSGDAISLTVTEIDQAATLTAGTPTATTVSLTIANYPDDQAWWYDYTPGGACTSVAAGTETVTGLTKATTYTFKAYNRSSCSDVSELAATDEVTTATPTLAVSEILKDGATLVLSGWVAGADGSWYYKANVGPDAGCSDSEVDGQAVNLTGLTPYRDYTYKAYSDNGCTSEITTDNDDAEFTTLVPTATEFTISNLGQTATTCIPFDPECGSFAIGSGSSWLTGFTTGSQPTVLTSVTAKLAAQQLHPGNVVARIYSNTNGAGTVAATLTGPVSPSNGEYKYACSGSSCALAANTWYGLAFEAPSGPANGYYRWQRTASDAEDTGGATGWSIGNGSIKKEFDQWTPGTDTANSGKFKVTAALPTSPGLRRQGKELSLQSVTNNPAGLWSDGTTMWVTQFWGHDKIFAYKISDGTRDTAKDITLPSGNLWTYTFTSDGTTIWFTSYQTRTSLQAYTLATGTRASTKDITLHADNDRGYRIWTDGTTMWVVDDTDTYAYAYAVSDGTRDTSKEFDLHADNTNPGGVWGDGATVWVSDWGETDKVYAYRRSDGTRLPDKDYNTLTVAGNTVPTGMWSDGTTMWIADYTDGKIYAYNAHPASLAASNVTTTGATLNLNLTGHNAAWWYQGNQSGASCTKVAAGTSTATLSLSASTAYIYKAYGASGCAAANELGSAMFTTP